LSLLIGIAILLIISSTATGSQSEDIFHLLGLATFGQVSPLTNELSVLGSDNETDSLNEFFFQRGGDGDLGINTNPCTYDYRFGIDTCVDVSDCGPPCSIACAGYDDYTPIDCLGNQCACYCSSLSGCGTCGSNALETCWDATDSATCQNSYDVVMTTCMWNAGGPGACEPSLTTCTPCFLAGTKIITLDTPGSLQQAY